MTRPAPRRAGQVDTVLLDAGGVLLDLDYAYLRRLIEAETGPEGGLIVPEEELSRLEAVARREIHDRVASGGRTGEAWRDYFHIILGNAGVPVVHQTKIIDALWEAHRRIGLWTVAVERGPTVVQELRRRGFRVGVVSNAEGRVARDLEAAGYTNCFETVVDSHVVGVEKPDPAIFRIALERMKAAAERSVFVGDLPAVDVAGARAAGIEPILVDRHRMYPEVEVTRVSSVRELPPLLGAH